MLFTLKINLNCLLLLNIYLYYNNISHQYTNFLIVIGYWDNYYTFVFDRLSGYIDAFYYLFKF